jgi:hypothetical protein
MATRSCHHEKEQKEWNGAVFAEQQNHFLWGFAKTNES